MPRALILVPALAIAALLVANPVAARSAADSEPALASIEFDLPANHGLHAHVETYNQEVTLRISRRKRSVIYTVDGEPTEDGLRAQFGALGQIDVDFQPTKTETSRPPKGCTGEPDRYSEGIFTGTIEFSGEREFVHIAADRVKGQLGVSHESEWRCPGQKRAARRQASGPPAAARPRKHSEAGGEPAILSAFDSRRHRYRYFAAFSFPERKRHRRSAFIGGTFEKREGMEITRATAAVAGASTFIFDHKAGTARVRPPRPFTGSATYKRRRHRRDLWRSTIRVPLLGSAPISLRGHRFRTHLVRDLPGD